MTASEAVREPQPEFRGFGKIVRHDCAVVVTEKIDGTNAAVLITENGTYAGGRRRWLTPGAEDQYGFAAWVQANEEGLRETLGPGMHRGEWYGHRVNRGYGLAERRLMLFTAAPDLVAGQPDHGLWEHPTLLYAGPLDRDLEGIVRGALCGGSLHVPGWDRPEGAVALLPNGSRIKVIIDKEREQAT